MRKTYIFAKLEKHTYTYNSLQFLADVNTRGRKMLTTFVPFQRNFDYGGRLWINKHLFLCDSQYDLRTFLLQYYVFLN